MTPEVVIARVVFEDLLWFSAESIDNDDDQEEFFKHCKKSLKRRVTLPSRPSTRMSPEKTNVRVGLKGFPASRDEWWRTRVTQMKAEIGHASHLIEKKSTVVLNRGRDICRCCALHAARLRARARLEHNQPGSGRAFSVLGSMLGPINTASSQF